MIYNKYCVYWISVFLFFIPPFLRHTLPPPQWSSGQKFPLFDQGISLCLGLKPTWADPSLSVRLGMINLFSFLHHPRTGSLLYKREEKVLWGKTPSFHYTTPHPTPTPRKRSFVGCIGTILDACLSHYHVHTITSTSMDRFWSSIKIMVVYSEGIDN